MIDRTYDLDSIDVDGTRYLVRVLATHRDDGLWEAFVELRDHDRTLVTPRETTQPNEVDLGYWVTSLSRTYLEGALARATA